jgi:hypothetical protein
MMPLVVVVVIIVVVVVAVVGAAASVSVSMSISILVSERVLKFVKFSPVTALAMTCVYAMGRGI